MLKRVQVFQTLELVVGTKWCEGKIQEIDPCPENHSLIYSSQQSHCQCGLHDIHQSPETKEMPECQHCLETFSFFKKTKIRVLTYTDIMLCVLL